MQGHKITFRARRNKDGKEFAVKLINFTPRDQKYIAQE